MSPPDLLLPSYSPILLNVLHLLTSDLRDALGLLEGNCAAMAELGRTVLAGSSDMDDLLQLSRHCMDHRITVLSFLYMYADFAFTAILLCR